MSTSSQQGFLEIPARATKCINQLDSIYPLLSFSYIVEPSSRFGEWVRNLPSSITFPLDLHPKYNNEIIKHDFLKWYPPKKFNPVFDSLIIGNPPSSKIKEFFTHAATFAGVIAFLLPLHFNKDSINQELSHFRLTYNEKVDNHYRFQIWTRGIYHH